MLDKLRKSPYGLVVWVGIVSVLHIVLFKDKIRTDYQIVQRIIFALLGFAFTVSVHELIHCFFMKLFSLRNIKIEVARDPIIGVPTLRTVGRGEVDKWKRIVIYLAPFVFLTLLLDISFIFCTKAELFFFVVVVCNSVGCYIDLIETLMMLRRKKSD